MNRLTFREKYQVFTRNEHACIFGVYGLTRKYCRLSEVENFNFRDAPVISLDIPEPQIDTAQVVVTSRCNMDCLYCSFKANISRDVAKDMSLGELREVCDFINRQNSEMTVLITGGEAELYPEAVDYLLENAAGRKILFTNGTLTNPRRLWKYAEHKAVVLFSLDGEEQVHTSMRKGKIGMFNHIEKSLALATETGIDFGISTVVDDHNLPNLPETVKTIHQTYKPHSIGLNLPHKSGDAVWLRIEEYVAALQQIFLYAKKNGLFIDQINRRLKPLVERRFRLRDCAAQGRKVVFFPGGRRTSCVNQMGLGEIAVDWKNTLPINSPLCQDCYALGICGGGCLFDGASIYGAGKFDERNCLFTKEMLEFIIWDIFDSLGAQAGDDQSVKNLYQPMLSLGNGTKSSIGHEA